MSKKIYRKASPEPYTTDLWHSPEPLDLLFWEKNKPLYLKPKHSQ